MPKPLGVALELDAQDWRLRVFVRQPSKVEDAVWEAVEQAIEAGWDPKRFKIEAEQAWEEKRQDDTKEEMKQWR